MAWWSLNDFLRA